MLASLAAMLNATFLAIFKHCECQCLTFLPCFLWIIYDTKDRDAYPNWIANLSKFVMKKAVLLIFENDLFLDPKKYLNFYELRIVLCLKITKKCFIRIFQLWHFLRIFDLSGNTIWPQTFSFQKTRQKWPFLGIFNELLSTQNVHVAHNVEWDSFCDFQTPCIDWN